MLGVLTPFQIYETENFVTDSRRLKQERPGAFRCLLAWQRVMSSSGLQNDEGALKERNRKMEQVRQWRMHAEGFQVEKGKLTDE